MNRRFPTRLAPPFDILNEPERGGAIERWVNVAADVPLEDAEKAAILEAVLAEILSPNRGADFQDVAERMSNSSMRVLLNAPSDRKFQPSGDDRGNFERLRELGLARKFDLARFLLLLSAWCIGTGIGLYHCLAARRKMLRFVASGDLGQQPPPRAILLENSDFQRIFSRP
jgi:hypothetical protein